MTNQQAVEIRNYLSDELINTGFGNILDEFNTRRNEMFEPREIERNNNPRALLMLLLNTCIEVLENLSNHDYEGLLNRFNQLLIPGNKLENISVETNESEKPDLVDLRNLPDYTNLIKMFRLLRSEIQSENEP